MDFLVASAFGSPFDSPVGQRIEEATNSTLQAEDWGLNMEICDIVNETEEGPRDAVKAIKKRIVGNKNFKEVMLTLTVLEACVKNCGHRFHLLVSTREFVEGVLVRAIMTKNNPPLVVQNRVLGLIQVWADAFRSSPSLTGVVSVYEDLRRRGVDFPMTTLNSTSPIHTPDRNPHGDPMSSQHLISASRNDTLQSLSPDQMKKLRAELEVVHGNMMLMSEMMNQLELGQVQSADTELLQQLYSVCLKMQDRVMKLIPVVSDEKLMEELLVLNDEFNAIFSRYTGFQKHLNGQSPAEQIPATTCTNLVDLSPPAHGSPASQQPEGQSAVSELSSHMAGLSAVDGDRCAMFTQGRNVDLLHKQGEREQYRVPGGQTGQKVAEVLDCRLQHTGLKDDTQDSSTVLSSSPTFDWMVEKGMIPVRETNEMEDVEKWLADHVEEDTTDGEGVVSKEFDRYLEKRVKAVQGVPPLAEPAREEAPPGPQSHQQLHTH